MHSTSTAVILLLSRRCNLSCGYCYLDRSRGQARMTWETLTAALGAALDSGPEKLGVEFTGGEPLLEADLLGRAVDFVDQHNHAGTRVEFSLTTNGTLLTPALLEFLFVRGFAIRLSFDGIAAVQDQRGPGTFAVLDRLLDCLYTEFPSELRKRVTVALTLTAAAIPHLAASVRYLLEKGDATIAIGPRLTWDPDWRASSRDVLQGQVDEIVALSVDRWRHTGSVPVGLLARPPLCDHGAPVADFLCSVLSGMAFCVEPDGKAFSCPLFEASLTEPPPLARRASRALSLGQVTDAGVMSRLADLRARSAGLRVLSNRLAKRSSYGECAACRYVADCHVCPASICHIPGNRDPDLVPDFICAFNYLTLSARERFDEMTGGEVSAAWYREIKAALATLEAAVRGAPAGAEGEAARPAQRKLRGPTRREQ